MKLHRWWQQEVAVFWLMAAAGVGFCDPDELSETEVRSNLFPNRVSVFAYVGQYTDTAFLNVARFDTDLRSSWVGVVGVTRELRMLTPSIRMDGEAQFGQHWGQQSHQEINALLTTRWLRFPWNEFLPTSIGFGFGFSYAFERPPLEFREGRPPDRFLVYLLIDLEVTHPRHPDWSLFGRIHHRSDGYGTIGDARATNFIGLGLRRRF